jgi:hypothetical protein
MAAQPWQWRRLNDEQLEAAAVRWLDREGAYYYRNHGKPSKALGKITAQILDEMNRRTIELPLFEDRPGYDQSEAM